MVKGVRLKSLKRKEALERCGRGRWWSGGCVVRWLLRSWSSEKVNVVWKGRPGERFERWLKHCCCCCSVVWCRCCYGFGVVVMVVVLLLLRVLRL